MVTTQSFKKAITNSVSFKRLHFILNLLPKARFHKKSKQKVIVVDSHYNLIVRFASSPKLISIVDTKTAHARKSRTENRSEPSPGAAVANADDTSSTETIRARVNFEQNRTLRERRHCSRR